MKKGINNPGFRALPSSVQNNILSNMKYGGKKYAAGGAMPMEQLTEFDEGGRHEENGLGGIPQGMNPEGQMNLVEEGETKFDAENYIYSDSLKVDKELAEAFNLNPKMVGKTFADASKMAGRKKSKREGDAIEMAANEKDLMNLMEAQEAFKQARIEEKLQEIAELDPNALPALMGQGQPQGGPQGDPAMGGQMQEAPMDEQAMMEQQMMAEQQAGGGQPSPEEMAMMQQQQDMAMGQQEGMMRNGGYTTRSYNLGGFMGMNMANAGMMTPGPCGTPGNPPCPGTKAEVAKINMDRMEDRATQDQSGSTIGSLAFSPHLSYDEEEGFEENRILQDLRKNMLSTYGASATDSDPAYGSGTGIGEFPGKERTGKFKEFVGKVKDNFVDKRENIKAFRQKPNTAGRRYTKVNRILNPLRAKDDRIRNTGNQYFAVKHPRATEDAEGNNLRALSNLYLGPRDKSKFVGRFGEGTIGQSGPRFRRNEFGGNLMQSGQEAGINPMQGMNQAFNMGGMLDGGLQGQGINVMQGLGSQMRKGGKLCYGCGGAMHNYGGRMDGMNQMATGGEIAAGAGSAALGTLKLFGSLDPTGTVNTGIDKLHDFAQERAGLVDPKDPKQDLLYNIGSTAGNLGSIALSGGASAKVAAGDIAKQTGDALDNVGEITGNEDLQKAGKVVGGVGQVASMFMGDAGSAASSAGNVAAHAGAGTLGAGANIADAASKAANAAKAAKFAKVGQIASNKGVQAGLNMGTQVLENETAKAEEERLAEEERIRIEREMMMTNDPNSLYYNPLNESVNMATNMTRNGGHIGTRSYGKGGGLWANIHAKRARIAAGSGESMRKPGSKGAPTAEDLKNSQNAMGGHLYNTGGSLNQYSANTFDDGGKLTLMKQIAQPDGTTINKSVTYNSLQQLLADKEIVNKYGGEENVKELFADKFKDSSVPYQRSLLENIPTPDPIYTRMDDMEAQSPLSEEEIAFAEMDPRQQMILQNTRNQLQVSPEEIAQIENQNQIDNTILVAPEEEIVDVDEEVVVQEEKEKEEEEKEKDKEKDKEIVNTDDISDAKFNFNYKESFPEFAASMAAPLYNIGSGLFSKEKDYTPKFIPLEVPKFDPTQAINNVKRQVSGLRRSLNKVGSNPSNLLALAQSGSRLENETLMTYDKLQKEMDLRGNQYNAKQKQTLEKNKKQLEMAFDEAKRKSIQEGIKQLGKIQEAKTANFLAAQYNAMAAPNMGTFEYTPFLQRLINNKKD